MTTVNTTISVAAPTNSSPPPPIYHLPQDTLHQIFSHLTLRQITVSKSVSKFFYQTLSSPSFLHLLSSLPQPLPLFALRPPHRHMSPDHPTLHVYDPDHTHWLKFPLSFLPFRSHQPLASQLGLLYLWADSPELGPSKSLLVCNPLTQTFKVLPQLGSAWSRHGSVLVGSPNKVIVLTELAALYFSSGSTNWFKFSSNLPSKPRSPILISNTLLSLCDVGSPWRSQWRLFTITLDALQASNPWTCLEKHKWEGMFDILKRPRLVKGVGNRVLMIGGLKSSFLLNSSCSTILILRLDLDTLEWDEAGRMPVEMFRCFQESSKFKVFGGGNRVCFSAKRIGKLALWDNSMEEGTAEWKWIDGVPGNGDGLFRGFLFEPRLDASP